MKCIQGFLINSLNYNRYFILEIEDLRFYDILQQNNELNMYIYSESKSLSRKK